MSSAEHTDSGSRNRKRKALLAGGVVLGLGAATTLAAWTDDVWVSGSFSAGSFNVQAAVDSAGTVWNEYNTSATKGGLAFTVAPTAMAPGVSVYAPLNLRVGPTESTNDAAISLPTAPTGPAVSNTANNAFFDALQVSLYNVAPANCDATGTGGAAVPINGFSAVPLTTKTTSTVLTLNKNMTAQGVCFKVTLPLSAPASVQGGTTGPLTWNFHAESI